MCIIELKKIHNSIKNYFENYDNLPSIKWIACQIWDEFNSQDEFWYM